MKRTYIAILMGLALSTFSARGASAATLYSATFDNAADISGWTVNKAPAASAANQGAITGFDYSAFGIPPAPGSATTLGMRLRANVPGGDAAPVTARPAGATSGLSVSPTGQNFGSVYTATFYAWSNFNGAANASGLADNGASEGGTNNVMFALGTSGTVPLVVGNTTLVTDGQMDGVGFATTGDGGITNDYRIYPKSGTITPAGANYAAGSTANTNAYYANAFPSQSAPAIQQTLSTAEYGGDASNTQAGSTQAGAFGFAWHKVVIGSDGTTAAWFIDDVPIANLNISSITMGGNNIAFGQSDVNTSTTRHPSLLFTVFDNLVVTDTAPTPEPASGVLFLIAACVAGLVRRRS
jgi:hypothetical protein